MRRRLISVRGGSAAEWAALTTPLAVREPGYDETNHVLKFGDGVSLWAALPSIGGGAAPVRSVKALAANADFASAVLADVPGLSFAIAAQEIWVVSFFLFARNNSAIPDIKLACTFPAGADATEHGIHAAIVGTATNESDLKNQSFSGAGTALSAGIPAAGTCDTFIVYSMFIDNGANAGTVQLQAAQVAADASPSTLKRGSYMVAERTT